MIGFIDSIINLFNILDFFVRIFDWIENLSEIIHETAQSINEVDFQQTDAFNYMGYFHYIVGTPTYILFTSVILISLGISVWTFVLKGIGFIRNLIPFN